MNLVRRRLNVTATDVFHSRENVRGFDMKMQVGSQRQKERRRSPFFSGPPRPPPPTLDHAQVHLPQFPPAHSGSNGAPRPGLCALLSALWKSAENSEQKHILTRTPDIHLGPPPSHPAPGTAGSDLSPLLSIVHRNNSSRLGSWSKHTHTHTCQKPTTHMNI